MWPPHTYRLRSGTLNLPSNIDLLSKQPGFSVTHESPVWFKGRVSLSETRWHRFHALSAGGGSVFPSLLVQTFDFGRTSRRFPPSSRNPDAVSHRRKHSCRFNPKLGDMSDAWKRNPQMPTIGFGLLLLRGSEDAAVTQMLWESNGSGSNFTPQMKF